LYPPLESTPSGIEISFGGIIKSLTNVILELAGTLINLSVEAEFDCIRGIDAAKAVSESSPNNLRFLIVITLVENKFGIEF
jgi:hypothetical protein